ncbi:hypothetical protein NC652_034757 [Populus alba x Populus x berolinensis]|nr:hypothetical protein NC652_034757 [Populus alba x Populus x berolinensis]
MDGSGVSCEEEEFIPGAASMLSSASMVDIKWVFDHLAGVQGPGTSKSLVLGFWRDLFLGILSAGCSLTDPLLAVVCLRPILSLLDGSLVPLMAWVTGVVVSKVVGVVCLLVWSSPWVEALLLLLYAAGFIALLVAGCYLLLEVQVVGGVCLLGCFVPCWFLGASLLLLLYAAGFAALLDADWIILLAVGSAGCRHCSPDG